MGHEQAEGQGLRDICRAKSCGNRATHRAVLVFGLLEASLRLQRNFAAGTLAILLGRKSPLIRLKSRRFCEAKIGVFEPHLRPFLGAECRRK